MSNVIKQVPFRADLKITRGEDFTFDVDFSASGVDFSAYNWGAGIVLYDTAATVPMTIATTDGTTGEYTVSLAAGSTAGLALTDVQRQHHWYFRRTDASAVRNYYAGLCHTIDFIE